MTKEIKKEFPNVNYHFQFGLCIKYILENKENEKEMKVNVLSYSVKNGLENLEGFITYFDKTFQKYQDKYFKCIVDSSVNDYNYEGSDITDEQGEELHDLIINNKYTMAKDEKSVVTFLKCAICENNYILNDKQIHINGNKATVKRNTKGFIHMYVNQMELFNNGQYYECINDYMVDGKGHLKEKGYEVI